MPLVIPNVQAITNGSTGYDMEAWDDATDWSAQLAPEATGTGVLVGCQVQPQASPNMTIKTTAGTVMVNGAQLTVGANASVTIAAAGASDRRDIIVYTVGTGVVAVTGTVCGTPSWIRTSSGLPPVKPSVPANSVLLGEIVVTSTTTSIAAINIVDKTTLLGGSPGTLLARVANAPSTATVYTLVNITTGLTALDTTNLAVTFIVPPSGAVLVKLTGFCHPTAATVASKIIFGVLSSTASPGTLVGSSALAYLAPTATIADNNAMATTVHLVTGLTPGTSLTWYFGGAFATAAGSVIAQGGSTNTTTPTGAPAVMEVWAANPAVAFSVTNLLAAFASTFTSTYTTASITPVANSLLVVDMSCGGQGTAVTFTLTDTFGDTGGGAWTGVTLTTSSNFWFGNVYYRYIGSSPHAGTITITPSASTIEPSVVVDQITGVNTTTPVAQAIEADASFALTGTVTLGSGPAATSLVYSAAAISGTNTPAVTTAGYTAGTTENSGTTSTAASAYRASGAAAAVAWGSLNNGQTNSLYAIEVNAPPPPPIVVSQQGLVFSPSIGAFTAWVNPQGASTTVSFNYGATSGYGSNTGTVATITGSAPVYVSFTQTGLSSGQTVHFQAVAVNTNGTTNGPDALFTTAAVPNFNGGSGSAALGAGGSGYQQAAGPAGLSSAISASASVTATATVSVALTAAISCSAAVTATNTEAVALTAAISATSAVAATTSRTIALTCAISATSALTAANTETVSLTASVAGAASVSATATESVALTSAIASSAVVAGTVTSGTFVALTAAIAASATVAAANSQAVALTAAVVGQVALSATAAEQVALTSAISVSAAVAANITSGAGQALTAAISATSALSSAVTSAVALSAAISVSSAVAANVSSGTNVALTAAIAVTSAVAAAATATAQLSAAIAVTSSLSATATEAVALSAAIAGSYVVAASVTSSSGGALTAAINVTSAVSATAQKAVALNAAVAVTSALAATTSTGLALTAAIGSSLALSANITSGTGQALTAAIVATSTVTATSTESVALSSAIAGTATLSASLAQSQQRALTAAIFASASVVAPMRVNVVFSNVAINAYLTLFGTIAGVPTPGLAAQSFTFARATASFSAARATVSLVASGASDALTSNQASEGLTVALATIANS